MRRNVGRSFRSAWVVACVLALAACGGSKKDDLGEPEDGDEGDALEETAPEVAPDGVADGQEEVPLEEASDAPGDAEVVYTCLKDKDCENANLGTGEACRTKKVCKKPENVCVLTWEDSCCREAVILDQGFENGLDGWTITGLAGNGPVGWSISGHRKALGANSLYFGDPQCRTYYNGQLGEDCRPVEGSAKQATLVGGAATSPVFFLPPLDRQKTAFWVSFNVWLQTEPVQEGVTTQPDLLRLQVITDSVGEGDDYPTVFTAATLDRNTSGHFVHVVGDLSEFTNQTIALRLAFDSFDGNSNFFEGVYVDDFKVATGCVGEAHPPCETAASSPCGSDGEACTDDLCLGFTNLSGFGVCEHAIITACAQPECTQATVATDCPVTGVCDRPTCTDGLCGFETLPPEQCCNRDSLLVAGFDTGLDDFTVWTYQGDSPVHWQSSPWRSVSGGGSLYYGDGASRTFVSADYVFGEATSPVVEVPATGYSFLSFQLFLATEFDDFVGEYYNPLEADLFTVHVVEDIGSAQDPLWTKLKLTPVWTSHAVRGTTLQQFVPVGVDLTRWAGKKIRILLRFDPSDTEKNNYEGVYVDDLSIQHDPCVRRNCSSADDCFVDGVCKTGTCQDQVCDVTTVGPQGCCSVQTECDDGNGCTVDGCLQNACVHDPIEKPGCCIPATLYEEHFDAATTLPGFAVADLSTPGVGGAHVGWERVDWNSRSDPGSMHFGNDVDYDNGGVAKGTATTSAIVLPSVGTFGATFQLFLNIEPNAERDLFKVEVVDGATATQVFAKTAVSGEHYSTWYSVPVIDLTAFRGKAIQLRFTFDSVDSQQNTGTGVFIDDLMVLKTCL